MKISLTDIGRRYNREWIFKKIHFEFVSGRSYAILGPNGSGKSTLLKIISGSLTPSQGTISYEDNGREITIEHVFEHVAIASPYLELIEEFTLREFLNFHFKFKKYLPGFDFHHLSSVLGLEKSLDKPIKFFSSGMKQRVKLVIACCSDAAIVLLDEPTSNLDIHGEKWYLDLVEATKRDNRIFIICSNQEKEYQFCDEHLLISAYK